ncbi:phosphatidylserine decarboxylase family protein [Ruegeria sp. 2012CJ41-6]|uniref:Phosphatidylserine decarboxylase family protein n=1 Tax=Ruegeria spongiae TaxID=2942209 RepID=A0ABT0Q2Q0_9RHOB|nr:phosphatidylserine decarboxylase family protein [Ruegeria spongiae]MCL6284155.1 phosphatidylserine decarboxylase family protein [Ruegeria spongiae]
MSSRETSVNVHYKVGKWLPSDQDVLDSWTAKIAAKAETDTSPLLPAVQNLKTLIETDAKAYMFFTQMFQDVPESRKTSPTGRPQVRDYEHMLRLFNTIMTHAPEFNESGLVGFPFNAILDWSMANVGGWAGFLDDKVDAYLRAMLNEWAVFLQSPESTSVLSDDPRSGWFGADARKAMPTFAEDFICDPSLPHYGFKSWDDFFTRRFREGIRPIADPDNDAIVVSACESAPYRVAQGVKLRDQFWIKAQPYALQFMLDNDPYTDQFDGGTVYQAFLSAFSYHRWHAPVSGRVVKTRVIEGTYYSEIMAEGLDPSGPNASQGYIAEVATRALIFIEAGNPDIGLMCFVAIGMAEVSTCDVTVFEGQHVTKGDEIGMFHFGGSTHCLLFRPEVDITFDLHGQTPGLDSTNILVNQKIATVGPRRSS